MTFIVINLSQNGIVVYLTAVYTSFSCLQLFPLSRRHSAAIHSSPHGGAVELSIAITLCPGLELLLLI